MKIIRPRVGAHITYIAFSLIFVFGAIAILENLNPDSRRAGILTVLMWLVIAIFSFIALCQVVSLARSHYRIDGQTVTSVNPFGRKTEISSSELAEYYDYSSVGPLKCRVLVGMRPNKLMLFHLSSMSWPISRFDEIAHAIETSTGKTRTEVKEHTAVQTFNENHPPAPAKTA